jgi:predicted transcriptional regulator of viral defense system
MYRGKRQPSVLRAGAVRALRAAVAAGDVERIARGIYVDATAAPTAQRSLAESAVVVPRGVVCLLSALRFHQLGTQSPHEVWMAIDVKAWKPRTSLPIHIVRFSGRALTFGVEVHDIEGVKVRVTSIGKTVADCFKYRHKLGIDVAVEALRSARQENRVSIDDLMKAAKADRVANVMRPYLEALS